MCVLFPAPRLSASVPCRVVGLHADMDSLRASLRAVAQTGVEQQNISHCIPNAFGPFGHGFNKSRTRMSAMPSLNPKIVWFSRTPTCTFQFIFQAVSALPVPLALVPEPKSSSGNLRPSPNAFSKAFLMHLAFNNSRFQCCRCTRDRSENA